VGKRFKHLDMEERETIGLMLAQGKSLREIGKVIGRNHTTVSREIEINAPPIRKGYYRAHKAQKRAVIRNIESHKRPRLKSRQIREYVAERLRRGWSPEQITGRLKIGHSSLSISHEAIYQYVYEENTELIKYLARSHRKRWPRGHSHKHRKAHIPERTPITERPPEVEMRECAGHWEGDTVVSKKSLAALQVLVERKTRIVRLTKMKRKTSAIMSRGIIRRLGCLPKRLRMTLTYDNGSENSDHLKVNRTLGMRSYFCAPYHSWEKGTVENSIGLIRRYFPKKTDFASISPTQVTIVENALNDRPRKCLQYLTPREAFSGAIAG
jgi:transposase, IS30 family